jgi:hypothetical protein
MFFAMCLPCECGCGEVIYFCIRIIIYFICIMLVILFVFFFSALLFVGILTFAYFDTSLILKKNVVTICICVTV